MEREISIASGTFVLRISEEDMDAYKAASAYSLGELEWAMEYGEEEARSLTEAVWGVQERSRGKAQADRVLLFSFKSTFNQRLLAITHQLQGTRATLRLTDAAAKAGADAALVYTPCFYKNAMTPPARISHFEKVADASPLPVILYNVPPNTGIEMSAETILALVNHPNIIGLKDSGGDVEKMGHVVLATKGSGFQVLAGSAGFLLKSLEVGCVGGVCAAANVFGPQVMELMAAYNDGEKEKASKLQEVLVKPNAAITRELGVPGLKTAMEWMGYYGGPVRPPLILLDQTQVMELMAAYNDGQMDKANKLQEVLVKPNAAITRELGVPGLKTAMEWMGYFGGPVRPPLIPLDKAQVYI